jgi:hypothetical protein
VKDLDIDREMVLKQDVKKWNGGMDWIDWLKTGTGDGLL